MTTAILLVGITAAFLFLVKPPAPTRRSGVITAHLVAPAAGAGDWTEVAVPGGEPDFHLFFRVRAPLDERPLQVEVLDDEGAILRKVTGITEIYRDAFLLFRASRADFPDGPYQFLISPQSDPSRHQNYRIDVVTSYH